MPSSHTHTRQRRIPIPSHILIYPSLLSFSLSSDKSRRRYCSRPKTAPSSFHPSTLSLHSSSLSLSVGGSGNPLGWTFIKRSVATPATPGELERKPTFIKSTQPATLSLSLSASPASLCSPPPFSYFSPAPSLSLEGTQRHSVFILVSLVSSSAASSLLDPRLTDPSWRRGKGSLHPTALSKRERDPPIAHHPLPQALFHPPTRFHPTWMTWLFSLLMLLLLLLLLYF